MSVHISLHNNQVYPWRRYQNFWFKGNIESPPTDVSEESIRTFMQKQPAGYVWIFEDENKLIIGADNIRSFPIFYEQSPNGLQISDEIYSLKNNPSSSDLNSVHFDSFLSLGFVPNQETLLKNIHSIQANNVLYFNKLTNHIEVKDYTPAIEPIDSNYESQLIDNLADLGQKLIDFLDGRPAIIPLSGGYDSRLILAILVKQQYPNIYCFTYGRNDSYEYEIAKKVTEQLNVEWAFVPYQDMLFQDYFDTDYLNYERYGSQLNAIAHEQDYFAIRDLKNQNKLPEKGIFLPGFCGDVLAGSQVRDVHHKQANFESFFLDQLKLNRLKGQKIYNNNPFPNQPNKENWQSIYEQWLKRNRLSQFITNAIRAYEFFGHQWYLPFWDIQFEAFWSQVPDTFRYERQLYKKVVNQHFFEPLGIDIEPVIREEQIAKNKVIQKVKGVLPKGAKDALKSLLIPENQRNINNLEGFIKVLLADVPSLKKQTFKDENEVHAAWYLHHLQNGHETLFRSSFD